LDGEVGTGAAKAAFELTNEFLSLVDTRSELGARFDVKGLAETIGHTRVCLE
jgi:hypothetical protein